MRSAGKSRFGCGLSAFSCLLAMVVMLAVGLISFVPTAQAAMRKDTLTIVTATGKHVFKVEVAESEKDKALGLMFRTTLARRAGMLFPSLSGPAELTMWMRNTFISLDMIFINTDGTVHRIEHATEPHSEKVIASQGRVAAVLEVLAGVAREIGLKPGDRIDHTFFNTASQVK